MSIPFGLFAEDFLVSSPRLVVDVVQALYSAVASPSGQLVDVVRSPGSGYQVLHAGVCGKS